MRLHVRESGPIDAPAILFLHGGGASGWTWEPVVQRLPGYHCLVPDLPAHGKSQDSRFSVPQAIEQLDELIEQKAAGKEISLVGLSLGAQVGLSMLAQYPQRFETAILSGLLAEPLPGLVGVMDWSTRLYMPFRNIPWLVRSNMKSLGVPEAYYPQFAEDTRLLTNEGFRDVMKANMTYDKPANLGQVQTPTLLLVGEKELRSIYQSARKVAGDFKNSRALMVEGAIHNWALQKPDLFAHTVQAWIENLSLPPQLKPLKAEEEQPKKRWR